MPWLGAPGSVTLLLLLSAWQALFWHGDEAAARTCASTGTALTCLLLAIAIPFVDGWLAFKPIYEEPRVRAQQTDSIPPSCTSITDGTSVTLWMSCPPTRPMTSAGSRSRLEESWSISTVMPFRRFRIFPQNFRLGKTLAVSAKQLPRPLLQGGRERQPSCRRARGGPDVEQSLAWRSRITLSTSTPPFSMR